MSGWTEWRDGTTIGVLLIIATFGLIHACQIDARAQAKEAAEKDATPLIETCVTHPAARRVVVQ